MLYNILLIVQIVVSVSIIGLVLVQHGKGADAGAAFGSGASGTVFGSRGSGNFLSRATGVLATIFFANSLALAWIVAHQPESASLIGSIPTEQVSTTATEAPTESQDNLEPSDVAPSETTEQIDTAPANEIPADEGESAEAGSSEDVKGSDIPE